MGVQQHILGAAQGPWLPQTGKPSAVVDPDAFTAHAHYAGQDFPRDLGFYLQKWTEGLRNKRLSASLRQAPPPWQQRESRCHGNSGSRRAVHMKPVVLMFLP